MSAAQAAALGLLGSMAQADGQVVVADNSKLSTAMALSHGFADQLIGNWGYMGFCLGVMITLMAVVASFFWWNGRKTRPVPGIEESQTLLVN